VENVVMREPGDPMPLILGPGEGERREARGVAGYFKALSATTGGQFSLAERELPPHNRMPPAHRHVSGHEAFYVLDGEVQFELGDTTRAVGAGGFVLVPPGHAHTFGNRSDNVARLLVLHSPPLDGYFTELEELWGKARPPPSRRSRPACGAMAWSRPEHLRPVAR
jgi:quercetin dioxygenase-like cupin family protein